MVTTVSPQKDALKSPRNQVIHLEEVAETIREDALTQAQAKLAPFRRTLSLEALLDRHDFMEDFKYGLSTGVAEVLAAHDGRVMAVYLFDPSANPDAEVGDFLPLDATVYLLLRVVSPSAALEAFIASLDRALTASLKGLPSPVVAKRTSILDIVLVTDKDVEAGTALARLLTSIHAPPLKIWQRAG